MSESGRIIRCYIEMDLVEGEHFNLNKVALSDDGAREKAEEQMVITLKFALYKHHSSYDFRNWIQSRILREEDGNQPSSS